MSMTEGIVSEDPTPAPEPEETEEPTSEPSSDSTPAPQESQTPAPSSPSPETVEWVPPSEPIETACGQMTYPEVCAYVPEDGISAGFYGLLVVVLLLAALLAAQLRRP